MSNWTTERERELFLAENIALYGTKFLIVMHAEMVIALTQCKYLYTDQSHLSQEAVEKLLQAARKGREGGREGGRREGGGRRGLGGGGCGARG